jgi:hypothetical protein
MWKVAQNGVPLMLGLDFINGLLHHPVDAPAPVSAFAQERRPTYGSMQIASSATIRRQQFSF